ncbi:MAG: right-handed parallel beta-helix repeat-containing protein [Synergistaceae bacterium]|nr:right-handed parallel beta-helix repeat-containing protein [Synergistota bacterium]NLM70752.1 right-handed parallel beta-helix repeat-containing protein [Synergistaceae bacterium]
MCHWFACNKRTILWAFVLSLLLLGAEVSEGAVVYVNSVASGTNDGTSWADAFVRLQDGLAAASNGDEVWVAAGVYKPTTGTDRYKSFAMKTGVAIFGGFSGSETSREQRDWESNETVLSGNIGDPEDHADNSIHVVRCEKVGAGATLDGFTVTGGNANYSGPLENLGEHGGGMIIVNGSPTIANCHFTGNRADNLGGGIVLYHNKLPVEIRDCLFSDNTAWRGGGVANQFTSSTTYTGCLFRNNHVGQMGGGMSNESCSSLEVSGCGFFGNSSGKNGGGMYNSGFQNSDNRIEESVFSLNTAAEDGGGMYVNYGFTKMEIAGCTFFGNNAEIGGGLWADINSPVVNCTFSANSAKTGGGMMLVNSSRPVILNCTFAENTASVQGGAIHSHNMTKTTATNCIFWSGGASTGQLTADSSSTVEVSFSVTDQPGAGNTQDDPMLGSLADNGGPTPTHALLEGSSAIDAGINQDAPPVDQRGVPRPQGQAVDMGSYESGGQSPAPTPPGAGGGGGCLVGDSPFALLLALPLLLLKSH